VTIPAPPIEPSKSGAALLFTTSYVSEPLLVGDRPLISVGSSVEICGAALIPLEEYSDLLGLKIGSLIGRRRHVSELSSKLREKGPQEKTLCRKGKEPGRG
jgi:hypothetical protein